MACPALPTCGLAVTESERVLPASWTSSRAELARLGLEDERFTVRMTGCPNGCARPYNADIGLVGRVGLEEPRRQHRARAPTRSSSAAGRMGDRLNDLYKDYVPFDQIVAELVPVFERFKAERPSGESFGDFCHRVGVEELAGQPDPA